MKIGFIKKAVLIILLTAPFVFVNSYAEDFTLKAKEGIKVGKNIKLENKRNWGYWKGNDSGALWTIDVKKPGKVTIIAELAIPGKNAGGELQVIVDGEEVAVVEVEKTGSFTKYKPQTLAEVSLGKGKHTISVVSQNTKGTYFGNLRGLKLSTEKGQLKVVKSKPVKDGSSASKPKSSRARKLSKDVVTTGETIALKGGKGKKIGKIKWNSGKKEYDWWEKDGSGVEWRIKAKKAGKQSLFATFSAEKGAGGALKVLVNGKEVFVVDVPDTGSWAKYKTYNLGTVTLKKGRNKVSLLIEKPKKKFFANLKGGSLGKAVK